MLGGENILCMGSDFDGCTTILGLENIGCVGRLYDYMLEKGYGQELTDRIFFENAAVFFRKFCGGEF
jgi:membrane dipeptidase